MERRRNHIVRTEQTEALDYLFWTKVNSFTYIDGAYIVNFTYPVSAKHVKQLCGCTDIEPITTDKAYELIPLQPIVDKELNTTVWIPVLHKYYTEHAVSEEKVSNPIMEQKPEQSNIKDIPIMDMEQKSNDYTEPVKPKNCLEEPNFKDMSTMDALDMEPDIKEIPVPKRKFNEEEIPRVLRELRNIVDTKPCKRVAKDMDIFDEEPRKKLRKYPTTDSIYRSVLKAQREYDELVAKGEMIDTILREYGFSEEVLQAKHKKPLKLYRSKANKERNENVPELPIQRTIPDVPVQHIPTVKKDLRPQFFSENANMDAAKRNVYLLD